MIATPLKVGQLDGRLQRDRPSWAITKSAATGTIVLRFVAATRTWEIPEFFAALNEMMPAENARVVFDLRELHSHNPDTKAPSKKWLMENKTRIGQITIVLPRSATLLKIAVGVLSLASGVKMRIRDDLEGEALLDGV
ncbi:MAG: hypothetical protein ABI895_18810 [Deltaproteobacteria bacterium]